MASLFPFEKLGRRAELLMPAYLGCIGGLCVMAALLTAIEPSDAQTCGYDNSECPLSSLGNGFWFVWVTFHACAYGDILPQTDTGRVIAALCSGAGYLFFVFVCLTAFVALQQPSGTAAAVLRQAVLERFKKCLPSYGAVVAGIIVLGVFFDAANAVESADENEDMPTLQGIFFAWNTFHHSSYGDRYPQTALGKLVAALVMCSGYFFPPYAIALGFAEGGDGGGAAAGLEGGLYAGAPS